MDFLDLDECVLGLHNCDRNTFCSNNDGGFKCACKEDYFGNGTFCFRKIIAIIIFSFDLKIKNITTR